MSTIKDKMNLFMLKVSDGASLFLWYGYFELGF